MALLFSAPALASDVTLSGRIEQGGIVIGAAPPGSSVTFADHTLPTNAGAFVIGIDRDAKETAELRVTAPDGRTERRTLTVAKRDWQIEHVDGVPQVLVTPDPETAAKIAAENKLMRAARETLGVTPFYET